MTTSNSTNRAHSGELLGVGAGEDILIVDDSEANLIAFEAALAPLGRKLVMVQSGVEALAKMLQQDFALAVLDVSMPGMSGIECAQMIRERERTRGLPLIFVTGLTVQDQVILDGYEAGGFDFVVKPVRAEVLRAKVRVFLELQQRTREMHRHARARQEQRHQAELLELRLAQMAEIDRRKDELLAILGHQLRGPLQAMQLAIDTLHGQDDVPPQMLDKLHDIMEQRVRTLNQLVDDLLGHGKDRAVPAFHDGKGKGGASEIEAPLPAPCVEQELRPSRPLRVVVCEDEGDIRELAANLLRADGHTVFQAADGAAAIRIIERERPDVAIVDIGLPDIDGCTVARTVRMRLGTHAPRFVAITALASAAAHTDFDEHLIKPASRERMLSVLARVSR